MDYKGLRKLPIGIQDFEKLRRDGCLYVDKTEQVYQLVSNGCYYFLSCPRRFGKSLLLSTIKAFFLGKKELFEDLAIASHPDVDWVEHPVLHLDLNTEKYDSEESLNNVLNENLIAWECLYGADSSEVHPKGMNRHILMTGRTILIWDLKVSQILWKDRRHETPAALYSLCLPF